MVDFSCKKTVILIAHSYAGSGIKIKASHTNLIQILCTRSIAEGREEKRNSKKRIVKLLVCRRSICNVSERGSIQTCIELKQQRGNIQISTGNLSGKKF